MNKIESAAADRIARRARQIVERKKQAQKDLPRFKEDLLQMQQDEPHLELLVPRR